MQIHSRISKTGVLSQGKEHKAHRLFVSLHLKQTSACSPATELRKAAACGLQGGRREFLERNTKELRHVLEMLWTWFCLGATGVDLMVNIQ